ncbi:hypothetical protein PMAYCL1PPCAC_25307, partial [Pristionchus mayeri]
HPPPMLRIILFSSLLSLVSAYESSCTSDCSATSVPRCGVWMNSERIKEADGIYKLNEGVMNVSCSFSSLPGPSSISWLHRPSSLSTWMPFTCSSKDEQISCSPSSAQTVSSVCILRTSALNMTGSYKCEAVVDTGSDNAKASSSEVSISVEGIESVQIVDKSLVDDRQGYVEAKICANPQPEVWWSTGGEGLLKPGQSLSNYASSHLAKTLVRENPSGPASPLPYCYQVRLIVNRVNKGEGISLLVRSHGDESTTKIVSASSHIFSFLSFFFVLSTFFF